MFSLHVKEILVTHLFEDFEKYVFSSNLIWGLRIHFAS